MEGGRGGCTETVEDVSGLELPLLAKPQGRGTYGAYRETEGTVIWPPFTSSALAIAHNFHHLGSERTYYSTPA